MFILISGYMGKKPQSEKNILYKLILPYVCFDLVYALCNAIAGDFGALNIFIPQSVYWYILCIAIMRFLTSKLDKKCLSVFTVMCVVISCVFSVISLDERIWRFMSIGRVFLLFPIYVFGYWLSGDRLKMVKSNKGYAILIPFVILVETLFLILGWTDTGWSSHRQATSINEYGLECIFMVLTAVLFVSLVCVMSDKKCFLTQWGRNSIVVYLVHIFAVRIALILLNKIVVPNVFLTFILYALFAVIITQVCSLNIFLRFYNTVMKWMGSKLGLTA